MKEALFAGLYCISVAAVIAAAGMFAAQYQQPWVTPLVVAGCAYYTARSIGRSL